MIRARFRTAKILKVLFPRSARVLRKLNAKAGSRAHNTDPPSLSNPEQQKIAGTYIKQLDDASFSRPIVTQVVPLKTFHPAEEHHKICRRNPTNPVCPRMCDAKVDKAKKEVPELLKQK